MARTLPIAMLIACAGAPERGGIPADPDPAAPRTGDGACAALTAGPEGAFLARDAWTATGAGGCTTAVHAAAGAAGSTLVVDLDGPDAAVSAVDIAGNALLAPTAIGPGGRATLTLVQAGEVLITVAPVAAGDWSAELRVTCADGCDLPYSRYPFVLMHGMGGASDFDGVDYFFEVPGTLRDAGYLVAAPSVLPFASSADRAVEWQAHLDGYAALGLGRRFNLIAHSQGGIDARLLAGGGDGMADPRVASVVTVGTPHLGTPVADAFDGGLVPDWLLDAIGGGFDALNEMDAADADLTAAIHQFTTAEMLAFDAAVPDGPDTYQASWGGVSCGALELGCQAANGGEVVDVLLGTTWLMLWADGYDSDGMVPLYSAGWGDVRGVIPADHADQIGQFDGPEPAFDPVAFYLDEVERLAAMGL